MAGCTYGFVWSLSILPVGCSIYIYIHIHIYTIWLFNIAMERSTILKFGKPSISMGHLYHGYVSHNQRVVPYSSCSLNLWGLDPSKPLAVHMAWNIEWFLFTINIAWILIIKWFGNNATKGKISTHNGPTKKLPCQSRQWRIQLFGPMVLLY